MRLSYPAVAIVAVLWGCSPALAQSSTDIVQRLNALERSNAQLKRENAALRDRVQHIESGNRTASATAPPLRSAPAADSATFYASASPAAVYKTRSIAPVAQNWTGFYVGAHGGYAWGRVTGPDMSIDPQGGFGGIQMGVNYQFADHWVLGFEQDASFANLTPQKANSDPGTIKFDAFGTFRERVGYTWDRVMLYQTAGVAWGIAHPISVVTTPNPERLEERRLMTGLAAGAGIEVMAASNLTLKAEYLFLDFPAKNLLSGTDQSSPADAYIHTFRVGVNWLFH
jgi:outer membrane immunogenic protein